MFSKLVVAFAAAAFIGINAQSIPDLPPCVLTCVTTASSGISGCDITSGSLDCLCTNTQFQDAAQSCLTSQCSPTDQAAADQLQSSLCADVTSSGSSGTGTTGSTSDGSASSSEGTGSSTSGASSASTTGSASKTASNTSGSPSASGSSPSGSATSPPAATTTPPANAAISLSISTSHIVGLISVLGGVIAGVML